MDVPVSMGSAKKYFDMVAIRRAARKESAGAARGCQSKQGRFGVKTATLVTRL